MAAIAGRPTRSGNIKRGWVIYGMVRPALGDEGEDVLLAAGEVRQGAVISPAPLYRAAGLQDTGVQVFADAHPPGHRRRMIVPDLVRSLQPKILGRELLTERQLDELDRAVRAHIEDPRTVMAPMVYFTAWGRKPG
jgi:hypothetical protein